ncbi:hypothetical protein ACFV7Q_35610 [Streptomyces sp. NPDC059851]
MTDVNAHEPYVEVSAQAGGRGSLRSADLRAVAGAARGPGAARDPQAG